MMDFSDVTEKQNTNAGHWEDVQITEQCCRMQGGQADFEGGRGVLGAGGTPTPKCSTEWDT